jgi:hypothetical protein
MHVQHPLRTGTPQLLGRDQMVSAGYIGILSQRSVA